MIEKQKKETKFEKDLKAFFPHIYKLHEISKWDKSIWDVVEAMIEMVDGNSFGEIRFTYQKGKINHIYQTKDRTKKDLTK